MKKNNLIIFLIIILIVSGIGIYLFLQQDSEYLKVDTKNSEKKAYTDLVEYKGSGGLNINYDSSKLVYNGSEIKYYLSFNFDESIGEIKEISATYTIDNNLEYIGMTTIKGSDWKLTEKDNKIKLVANKPTSAINNFYYLQVKVKNDVKVDKVSIELKGIIVINKEGKKFSLNNYSKTAYLNKRENYKYEQDNELGVFNFYKYNVEKNEYIKVGDYECVAVNCFPYATQHLSFVDNFTGNMLIVKEVNNSMQLVLINYEEGVIDTYKEIYYGMYTRGEYGGLDYLIVETLNGKKKIISPYNGTVIRDVTDYELNSNMTYLESARRFYSVEKSRLVVAKNDKWGVIDISTGNVVVDLKYEDVKIFDDYRYAAKENGKWYFFEFEGNKKMIETGYDEIFHIDSQNMLVQDNQYIYIKDLEGNNLIEDKIKVFVEYNEFACCAMQNGVRVDVDGSTIDIYVDTEPDEDYNYSVYHYRYDGMKNTLKKLD